MKNGSNTAFLHNDNVKRGKMLQRRFVSQRRRRKIILEESSFLSLETYIGAEAAEEGVPEVTEREGEILVEEVSQELADAKVRPATVNQKQSLEEAELGDAVVRGENRLHPLLTRNANANVRR